MESCHHCLVVQRIMEVWADFLSIMQLLGFNSCIQAYPLLRSKYFSGDDVLLGLGTQGHITELVLIPHFARGHLFVKIAFWLFLLHFLKLPSLLHSDHWDCCIIVEYSQTLIYSFSQVESASSERERSLLIKITELQNRLIICPFLTCLYTFPFWSLYICKFNFHSPVAGWWI
jgi:hypothetical protein